MAELLVNVEQLEDTLRMDFTLGMEFLIPYPEIENNFMQTLQRFLLIPS